MNTMIVSGLAYFAIIVAIGLYLARNTKSGGSDYYLADRKIGLWAGALSASASSESAWVMMGLAGAAYTSGLSVLWLIPGCTMGYAFNWFVLAKRINEEGRRTGALTLPELIGTLANSQMLRYVVSLIIVVLLLVYTSAQFLAVGKTFARFEVLDLQTGVVVGALIIGTYISFGGMRASIYTDVLQSLFMLLALVALPFYAYIVAVNDAAAASLPANFFTLTGEHTGFSIIGLILGWSGIGLAYPGQPHIHSRFLAMSDTIDMRRAGVIAISWSTLVFLGAILGGVAGRVLMPEIADKELVLVNLALQYLHPVVGGIVIAAIFSAIASTADSQLLAVTSTLKNDFPLVKNSFLSPRIITIMIATFGAYLASMNNTTIFDLVLDAWEILGVTIGSAVIGVILLKRHTLTVLAAMGVGVIVLLGWKYTPALSGLLYAFIPASLASIAILLAARQTQETQAPSPAIGE